MPDIDPQYADRTRDSFARQGAMRTLGAEIAELAPGRAVLAMRHKAGLTQQHGFVHAGMVSAALDSACGYAAFTLMPADAAVLTIEFKVNLLAPAKGPFFRIEAEVVKAGRTISVVDGRAYQLATAETPMAEAKLIATMTATVMTVLGRDGLKS